MSDSNLTAVLLLSCPDRVGLVSRISHFIFERGGNILDLDEHVDTENSLFFIRVSWSMEHFSVPRTELNDAFQPLAREFKAIWKICYLEDKMRVAILVSKYTHAIQELLWRYSFGEFNIEIPLVISNHPDLKDFPYHHTLFP